MNRIFQMKAVLQMLKFLKKSLTGKIIGDNKISYRLYDSSYKTHYVVQCEEIKNKNIYRFLTAKNGELSNTSINQNIAKFLYEKVAVKHSK